MGRLKRRFTVRRRRWMTPAVAGVVAFLIGIAGWLRSEATAAPGTTGTAAAGPGLAPVPTRSPSDGKASVATLTALGDSTGAGVGAESGSYVDRLAARLLRSGPRYVVANLAMSGATTRDVLAHQLPRMADGVAGLVVVGIGTNDLMSGVPPATFAQRFEAILAGIRARTKAPIVVSNVPDVSLTPAVPDAVRPAVAARVDAYNDIVAKVARNHAARVFDLCALTRKQLPSHPEYLSADGYHPSDQGYEAWADGLWRVVRPVL